MYLYSLVLSELSANCLVQVFAQENWEGQNSFIDNYRPDGGKSKVFNFAYHPKITDKTDALEEAQKYINTTVAQLFYTTNLVHDLYYRCVSVFNEFICFPHRHVQIWIR